MVADTPASLSCPGCLGNNNAIIPQMILELNLYLSLPLSHDPGDRNDFDARHRICPPMMATQRSESDYIIRD